MNHRPYMLAAALLLSTLAVAAPAQAEDRPCLLIHVEEIVADLATSATQQMQTLCVPDQVPIPDTSPADPYVGLALDTVEQNTPDEDPTLPPCTDNNVVDIVFDCANSIGPYVQDLAAWATTLTETWGVQDWSHRYNDHLAAQLGLQQGYLQTETSDARAWQSGTTGAWEAYTEIELAKQQAYSAQTQQEASQYLAYATLLAVVYTNNAVDQEVAAVQANSHEATQYSQHVQDVVVEYLFTGMTFGICSIFSDDECGDPPVPGDLGEPEPAPLFVPGVPDPQVWVPATPPLPGPNPDVTTPELPADPVQPQVGELPPLPPMPPMPGESDGDDE